MRDYLTIAGVTVPAVPVQETLTILREAPRVMITQPLLREGNPLGAMDHRAIAQGRAQALP